MEEQKRYTAQEMREHADYMREYHIDKRAVEMLRQAADSEEENAKLKARMGAAVKEFGKRVSGETKMREIARTKNETIIPTTSSPTGEYRIAFDGNESEDDRAFVENFGMMCVLGHELGLIPTGGVR